MNEVAHGRIGQRNRRHVPQGRGWVGGSDLRLAAVVLLLELVAAIATASNRDSGQPRLSAVAWLFVVAGPTALAARRPPAGGRVMDYPRPDTPAGGILGDQPEPAGRLPACGRGGAPAGRVGFAAATGVSPASVLAGCRSPLADTWRRCHSP